MSVRHSLSQVSRSLPNLHVLAAPPACIFTHTVRMGGFAINPHPCFPLCKAAVAFSLTVARTVQCGELYSCSVSVALVPHFNSWSQSTAHRCGGGASATVLQICRQLGLLLFIHLAALQHEREDGQEREERDLEASF